MEAAAVQPDGAAGPSPRGRGRRNPYNLRISPAPTPTEGSSCCYAPQLTPDGRTIVFVRRDGDVYRVGADGKGLRRLTEGNRYVEFRLSAQDAHGSTDGPQVSPDGKRVAYVAVRGGVANVWAMRIDGGGRRQVTFREAPGGRPRWGPAGKRLACVAFEGKYPQRLTVAAAGGAPRRLTHLDGGVSLVNWGPRP